VRAAEAKEPPLQLTPGEIRRVIRLVANGKTQDLGAANRCLQLVRLENPPQIANRPGGRGDGNAATTRDLSRGEA
jgi:hypothetical protein